MLLAVCCQVESVQDFDIDDNGRIWFLLKSIGSRVLSWEEDQDCFCVELIESFVTEIMEPGLTLVHVVSFGLHRGGD